MSTRRAFVGPLGDDIPSIFPIIAGVLLFITTVAYVNAFVGEKNAYLGTRKTALGLAYIVTKQGTVTIADFNSACGAVIRPYAKAQGPSFAVVLKKFCTKIALNSYPFDPRTYDYNPLTGAEEAGPLGGSKRFLDGAMCYTDGLTAEAVSDPANMPADAVILNYPIAVRCPDEASLTWGLGMANIMVWNSHGALEKASGIGLK